MVEKDPLLMNDIELQDAYLENNLNGPIDPDVEQAMLDRGIHPNQQF